MVKVSRGDVVLCDLNPVVGTEQSGIRPVVIVQIDRVNNVSPHTIIVPCTSKIRSALLPSHVVIPMRSAGLPLDSVILCEQVRVIDTRRIQKVIGHLSEEKMDDISTALSLILGISPRATPTIGG